MKKLICLLLVLCLLPALAACGSSAPAPEPEQSAEGWSREGYYSDEDGRLLSVTWMEDMDEPGWYVGFMNGEDPIDDSFGGILTPDGDSLYGSLASGGDRPDVTVRVSAEGEDGLLLAVEGGESYRFKPMELPEATIFVSINTEGWGNIDWAVGENAPEIDPDYPYQSAQINLGEPAVHTFVAWPNAGSRFVKWTKNGEDFSTEPQISVLLDESADFVAVFEDDPDWQNPVMNFIGEYQCDRAHALVECFALDEAWITISWGGSAWETAQWDIVGKLDPETLTITYSGCAKRILTYGEDGELASDELVYGDGTGTIVFGEDGSFVWHEDQSDYGTDMKFEWVPVVPD